MSINYFFLFSFLLSLSTVVSQNEYNQFDEQGKRHGDWKKNFDGSSQIRYEGTFDHGKEIGVFKFYCHDCGDEPMIVKTFKDSDDTAFVKYYTKKGKLVSEGEMIGKNRIGEWLYYHKKAKTIMTKEEYVDGKLEGQMITYYANNIITEEITYKNGAKEGINNYYSPEGILLKKLQYKNDQLEGPALYYDAQGTIVINGQYKNGKKHANWKYFEKGKLVKEETFPKHKN